MWFTSIVIFLFFYLCYTALTRAKITYLGLEYIIGLRSAKYTHRNTNDNKCIAFRFMRDLGLAFPNLTHLNLNHTYPSENVAQILIDNYGDDDADGHSYSVFKNLKKLTYTTNLCIAFDHCCHKLARSDAKLNSVELRASYDFSYEICCYAHVTYAIFVLLLVIAFLLAIGVVFVSEGLTLICWFTAA